MMKRLEAEVIVAQQAQSKAYKISVMKPPEEVFTSIHPEEERGFKNM